MPAGPDSLESGQSRTTSPARSKKKRAASGSESATGEVGARGPAQASVLLERIPPQDLEAEVATLGSMLLDAEAAGIAAEQLDAEHFYK